LHREKAVARTTKKRAKQLKHDKFRDTTMGVYERLSQRFEGRERTILYAGVAVVAVVVLALLFNWWRGSRADAANLALSKAIEIAEAPVTTGTPQPGDTGPTFPNEQERARRAVEAFQKVQKDYGSPYSEIARYFAAANMIWFDRAKGLSELEAVSRGGNEDLAARAKFALAQAHEAGGEYDAAAKLYQELLGDKSHSVSENTLKLRLASVYEKQGKKDEAVNLLFGLVEAARKPQGKEAKPQPESPIVHAAADKLQELSPERYAQLPPESAAGNSLPF
jgi:hypothetical protein